MLKTKIKIWDTTDQEEMNFEFVNGQLIFSDNQHLLGHFPDVESCLRLLKKSFFLVLSVVTFDD